MNSFKQDCIEAIKELQDVVRVLENQEKFLETLEKMNLSEEQREIFANFFLDKDKP